MESLSLLDNRKCGSAAAPPLTPPHLEDRPFLTWHHTNILSANNTAYHCGKLPYYHGKVNPYFIGCPPI